MDFSDIFSDDTWNTVSNFTNAVSPIARGVGAVLGGLEGTRNQRNLGQQLGTTANQLTDLFSPDSPYAKQLRQQLERKDAAAGRRSQYGTRETELAAQLAKQQAAVLANPQYAALLGGANRSTLGPALGALGYLTQPQAPRQNGTSRLVNQASNLNTARRGFNTLSNVFSPAETGTAADLGGAGAALGEDMGLAANASNLSSGGGLFAAPEELGISPYSTLNTPDAFSSLSTSIGPNAGGGAQPEAGFDLGAFTGAGDLASAGLGGAGSALSGMGAGSLAGTVGGADTLGGILGGTGFLPSYGAAGGTTATGLFGGGGAAGGGAGAGSTAAGASGFALPALTALPFLAALYGFGSGILGKGDNGNPFTQSQEAMAQNLYKQNQKGNISTLEDLNKYGGGNVGEYAQQQGFNPGDMNSYDAIRQQLQQQSGGGTFLGNWLSGNLMDNGGG